MIKSLKIFFCLVFLLINSGFVIAQSSSSYSRIGIGDIVHSYSARKMVMGAGIALSDPDFISVANPASLSKLNRTRLETGIAVNALFIKGNTQSSYNAEAEFNGVSIALPISKDNGVGLALGIIPYSNVSYEVVEDVTSTILQGQEYKIYYEGRGGLSKLFIAASYTLPFDLTLGASLDYYFGNLKYISRAKFVDTRNLEADYERTYSPKGTGTTIGVITPDLSGTFNSEKITNFRFGISASLVTEFDTDTLLTSTSNLGTDTIGIGLTNMKLPMRLNAGLSLLFNTNYLVTVDYIYQPWSKFEFNNRNNPYLRDAIMVSGGIEYKPTREPGSTFWEQIIWRAGLSFEQSQYIINNVGINQYSISGGLSLPLSPENTFDIGIQYSMRGTTDSNLFSENIFRLNVGVSLGEIWFIRQEK